MKNPMPLFDCKCKLDAYFLKNIIQRITFISVEIVRDNKKLVLIVEDANFYKAKAILDNQLDMLPSVLADKVASDVEEEIVVENREIESVVELEDARTSLGGFSLQALFMNFSF